jgi:phage portal protein BeeE
MALLDRINAELATLRTGSSRFGVDELADWFSFGGSAHPIVQTTMGPLDQESVGTTTVGAYKGSSPVFALVLARLQAFSQVRFQWTRFVGSQPSDLFGSPELSLLERPAPGWTTSDLLARMEVHVSGAGNAYVHRVSRDRLALLRPDRVTIVMGSQTDATNPAEAPDVEVVGYLHGTSRGKVTAFTPNEVAHYAPYPDPDSVFLGMSWVTPALREYQADTLAVEHKARFFTNAGTPNMAIRFDASITLEQVKLFKALLESEHKGTWNAWKTLYLGGGADPVPIGSSFKDMDYAIIQGRAESRLAADAGVPPSWVGFSEGLQGSALNAGNFTSARRRFSDGTMWHLWTNAATSLERIVGPPHDKQGRLIEGASLWFDPRVPFTRDDAADLAKIQAEEAQTIATLVKDGFAPESVIRAVANNDWSLLKHSGWYSVQLQPPPTGQPNGQAFNGQAPKGQAVGVGS